MMKKVSSQQPMEVWMTTNQETVSANSQAKPTQSGFSSLFVRSPAISLPKSESKLHRHGECDSPRKAESSSTKGNHDANIQVDESAQADRASHHEHPNTPLPLRPYATFLFTKMQIFVLITLLVIFSIPVEPYESVRLFNRSFWLLLGFVGILSFATVLFQIELVIRLCNLYHLEEPPSSLKIISLCLAPQICLWMTLNFCIVTMLLCGVFPLPFYGMFFGGFGTVFVANLALWKAMVLIYPEVDTNHVRRSIIFSCKVLLAPLIAFLMEAPFILGIYLLDSRMQMLVIFGFQVMNLAVKFFLRLAFRKTGPLFGLTTHSCNLLILSSNVYMEFVLQFYVSVVSPNIKDPKVYGFFFAVEAFSLALNPILDSDTVRTFARQSLKKVIPSESDFIDKSLTIGTMEGRVFSIQNVASCFFVRITSSVCYMFLATFMFYGFNKNAFVNANDITMTEYRFSMGYCACSIVLAVVQLIVTIRVLYSFYRIDMGIVWEKIFHENFFGMYSGIVLVFCHVIATISPQFYGLAFLIRE